MNSAAGGADPRPTGRGTGSRFAREWLGLCALLLAVSAYAGYELRASREAIETAERERLAFQARLVEKRLGATMQATGNALAALASHVPEVLARPAGVSAVNERLQVMASAMSGVRTFLVVNAQGIVVASNRNELIGGDWSKAERYRAMRSNPDPSLLFISPPFMTPLGNWALSLGRVVLDARGAFDGYILAIIDPAHWNLLLDSTRYAPDMSVAMIHGGGTVIHRIPDQEGEFGLNVAGIPGSSFDDHVRSGQDLTSWRTPPGAPGGDSLVVLQTVARSAGPADGFLVLRLGRDASAMLAPWRKEARGRAALLAGISLASMAGLYVSQRRRATAARLAAERNSEREKQAGEIRESEIRYRTLVEALPVGITEADTGGGNVFANATCQSIVGRSAEEIRGASWHDAIHPADRERVLEDWYAAVEAGRPFESDYRLVRPDGSVREVHGISTTLRAPDGRVSGYLGVIRDVTSQRLAEAERRASETRYRDLVELSPDALFVNRAERIEFVNRAAIELFGATRADELLGKSPFDLFAPDFHPVVRERLALLRAGVTVPLRRYRILRLDRTTREVEVAAAPFQDARGTAIQVILRDVTDQLRRDDALRVSEQRFRDVVASADEYIFEMDAHGTLTFISEAAEKILGYRPEEMVGQVTLRFMPPAEQARSAAFLAERVRAREPISHHSQEAVHRDGRTVWLDVSAVPVLAVDGSLAGYRGAVLDVTRRHRAEQERAELQAQLAHAQKMEGIGRLAGGIAHDFNNILSVILSCAGCALEDLKADDPVREDVVEIEKSAVRAAALTRQLLAFSRKQLLQPESLDLNRVIGEMEKMLRRIIGEDVRLGLALAPDLATVTADPGQVEQVIMNLVVNARDAMPEGGTLTIRTANVGMDEERGAGAAGPQVMLAVADSGVGMDEATLARVFEPFFTTKEVGKGSGLGLSTVYGIVKQSGGSIHVESEVGRGTTFRILLPRGSSPPARERPAPAAAPGARGETVLLVEDEEAVRNVAKRILEGAGYAVLPAASAAEALRTCEQHAGEIHLLLTDVVMPQTSGSILAERLAGIRPSMKVLFMSGHTDDAVFRHGLLDGSARFLAKPFTPPDLLAKVREAIDDPEALDRSAQAPPAPFTRRA